MEVLLSDHPQTRHGEVDERERTNEEQIQDDGLQSKDFGDNPDTSHLEREFAAKSPRTRNGRNPWALVLFLAACGIGIYFVWVADKTTTKSHEVEKTPVFETAKARAKVVPGKEEETPAPAPMEDHNFNPEVSEPTREDLERQKQLEEKQRQAEALRLARLKSAIVIVGGQASPFAGAAGGPNSESTAADILRAKFSMPVQLAANDAYQPSASNVFGDSTVVEDHPSRAAMDGTAPRLRLRERGNQQIADANERFFEEKSGLERGTVYANRLSHLNYTVLQGKMIDCILETAIQSDLPGQLRCSTSNDVYAESGRQIMLPAKTRMIGQYNSSVRKGQVRVFVIWQRAISPDGVDVQLDSPGTDALGRAGLSGDVDNHYLEIFGVSAMLSIIGAGASSYGVSSGDQPNSASAYRQAIQQSFAQTGQQILSPYAQIQPTIHVNQGEAIKIFVNRDLDFSNIYAPRTDPKRTNFTVIQ